MADLYNGRISARPSEIEQIQQQRASARLVCAASAVGQTKAQRRADLRELLDALGLWPVDDPT
jgi:hypothetical protein